MDFSKEGFVTFSKIEEGYLLGKDIWIERLRVAYASTGAAIAASLSLSGYKYIQNYIHS